MMEIHCIVSGKVQNVAYRYYAEDAATKLGVTGSVKNMSDGTVEVIAQGETDVLKEFIEYLNEGSLQAEVAGVSVDWGTVKQPLHEFSIIH